MAVYSYTALDSAGRRVKGVIEGDTARAARTNLRAQALVPIELSPLELAPLASNASSSGGRSALNRVRAADYDLFCRLVGSLLEAGLELSAALQSAAKQASPRARPLYLAVHAEVQQGKSLSEALAASARSRSTLSLAALAAGERTGNIAQVLLAIADHAERRAELRSRVKMALVYPAVLSVVAIGVVTGLMAYVVPEVVRVFDGFQQELPLLTRVLVGLSDGLNDWGSALLLVVLAVFAGAPILAARADTRLAVDRLTMRLPIIANMRKTMQREQFLDTLAMLLGGGVPLVEALQGTAAVMTSEVMKASVLRIAREVESGRSLEASLEDAQLLSPVSLQLVAAGVEGARLEVMLARAANLEREQIKQRLALALALLEPAMIILMGGFVLLIVIAILLPVFELNRLVA
jgi:general secretion pathway protein F